MRVYYTPPQFGGDHAKGMALVQDAIGLFDGVKRGAAEPSLGQADALAWFACCSCWPIVPTSPRRAPPSSAP